MLMIPTDKLEKIVSILGSEVAMSEEMEGRVLELVGDATLARRLVVWIPEAFGLVLVSHLGKINPPKTFSAISSSGKWVEFDLDREPIFLATLPIAQSVFHAGPRSTFQNIANRSSAVAAANNVLNAGGSIEGATMSGPALIGIPAEAYAKAPKPLWRRPLQ